MKTDPRSLIMAFAFFTIFADFVLDMIEYSQFTLSNTFPAVSSYLNYSTAWTTALNDLGGNWSFLGYSFTNPVYNILTLNRSAIPMAT